MVRDRYDPGFVEQKWQERWEEAGVFNVNLQQAKNPFYALVMFPYPSGDRLHVGHWYNFAPADSYARFQRMSGHDVFEPIGFDAFGLPAENYAVKSGIPPLQSTAANIATMTQQFKRMGCMYDWSHSLNTSDPSYYRWTQWLFLQMEKRGLAYRKEAPVNFCPSCATVLAREQCQDGTCERCGTEVIQKPLTQWFWAITRYAQRLLDGLSYLDWPEKTKLMQKNWIGRSEGAEVHFAVAGKEDRTITVFTTRVDTLFGTTFLVLAPEHPLVEAITPKAHWGAVYAYREQTRKKTELQRTDLNKEKTGVATGAFAVNPATGEHVPIWIADFVLSHYGTGAVFADAHDERDFAFAKKYGLSLKTTLKPVDGSDDAAIRALEVCFSDDGILYDSGEFSGLRSAEARKRITSWLEDRGKGRTVVTYRLKDWLISRQRYWGAPIPIVYDPAGKLHPIPEKYLPWLLPTDVEFRPTGESPLRGSKELKERTERLFGKGWTPEYDTMDTFVCSSFYYLRYLVDGNSPLAMGNRPQPQTAGHKSSALPLDPQIERKWMPVHCYIGGPEHACMHLIYARFVMMALKDFGFVAHEEPFKKLVHQGLITNQGAKMSKSKGNVVSPDGFIAQHGSDVFRMYLMFMGPFTDGGDWSDTGIKGIDRFVQRMWKMLTENVGGEHAEETPAVLRALHVAIAAVTRGMETMHFNTAISNLMTLLNALEGQPHIARSTARTIALLLAPLAPHLAEELWETLGPATNAGRSQAPAFAIQQKWPTYDPRFLVENTLTVVVQVHGRLRGEIVVPATADRAAVVDAARAHENVRRFLAGRTVAKEIVVPGKLVNFVLD